VDGVLSAPVETLLLAGEVVLPAAGAEPRRDAAVLVRDGVVAEVGEDARLTALHPDARRIGGRGTLVVPGLVNAHGHAEGVSTLQLGFADAPFEPWMARMHALPTLDPYVSTLMNAVLLLESGVTAHVHMHFPAKAGYHGGADAYLEELERALAAHRAAGQRVALAPYWRDRFTFVYDDDERFLATLPADLAGTARAAVRRATIPNTVYVDAMRELHRRVADEALLSCQLAVAAPQWASDALLEAVAGAAAELGTRIHLHALESRLQRRWGDRAHGGRELEHLARLGVLGPHAAVAHAVHLRDTDVEVLARAGASVVHNPSSNARLACGIAPIRRLAAAGVPVAIGTDDMALADDEDMWGEIRMAHVLQRVAADDDPLLGTADVLRMAWEGGARVAGLTGAAGMLVPGAPADAALLDLAGLRGAWAHPELPLDDLLVGRARREHVRAVVAAGRVLLEDGRVRMVDRDALTAEVAEAAAAAVRADPAHAAFVDRLAPWIARWGEGATEVARAATPRGGGRR
jgi:5-methylthioadenosine/S-adenosylhomocysteine deaminase